MASRRRYFVRYNEGLDRIEDLVTDGKYPPKSPTWQEVFVPSKCCGPVYLVCDPSARVFTSAVHAATGTNFAITVKFNGVTLTTSSNATLATVITNLNTLYNGFATFSDAGTQVVMTTQVCGTFAVSIVVTP